MALKDMLRLVEVAERVGLSTDTLRRRCRAGEIGGAVLDGKTWYIPERSIKHIERRAKSPTR